MIVAVEKNTRRFTRVNFKTPVQFHDGTGVLSDATLNNVCYGGLNISTGRYLKPQTLIRIPVQAGERRISFPAKVMWCLPDPSSETFRVGLQADHRGKHTMAILSSWVLEAFREEVPKVC